MAVAIIGTGLSGLACAQTLAAGGEEIVLFDKSKGYGGRMASRRQDGVAFDHGLPSFDPVAAETIPALTALPAWQEYGRVAAPQMTAFPRGIGEGFESRMGARVVRIDTGSLDLTDENGTRHRDFSKIVVAIPAPQAHELLGDRRADFGALEQATYAPCCTLMLGGVDGGEGVADRIAPETGPIALLIRDDTKPGHPAGVPCFVAHARRDWSAANVTRDKPEIADDLSIAFAAMTGLDPTTTPYRAGHRWLYSQPDRVVPAPFLLSSDGRIGACGDWAGADRTGGDARAAWRSGEALGRAMLG